LDGRKRQEALGEKLYQRATWKHSEVPFRLYSFRSQETEAPCTRLPFMAGELPEPNDEEQLEAKEQACLDYMDEKFGEVQHNFKKIGHTFVNLVRLVNGAVRAGKIATEDRGYELLEVFQKLGHGADSQTIYNLLDCAEKRADLRGERKPPSESTTIPSRRTIVVVDDEVEGEEAPLAGQSPWAAVLGVLFKEDGFDFETHLPSEIQKRPHLLDDADLVLMDIDFSKDPGYESDHPEFGGRELLESTYEKRPHLPIVMLSAYDEGELLQECLQTGAFDYLTKDWGTYAKHKAQESEMEWFGEWQRAIEVPLYYEPFFEDTRLLNTLGVVGGSGGERLRAAVRDIENPTIETAQTLATFFEEFVDGYLYYRGELPKASLGGSLGRIRKMRKKEFPLGRLLRLMRNELIHAPSLMHEKWDAWLYLLLLRTFVLRSLERRSGLENGAWMKKLIGNLSEDLRDSAALDAERNTADKPFFKNRHGEISRANKNFIQSRNAEIELLAERNELNEEEFQFHIDALIRGLGAIFPRKDRERAGIELEDLGDPDTDVDQLVGELVRRSKPKGRYHKALEGLAPIDWVLNTRLRNEIFSSYDRGYEGRLRRALAMRCWLWYFDYLLAGTSGLLFESIREDRERRAGAEEEKAFQESLYDFPDKKLVQIFLRNEQSQYLFYYCLRIGLHKLRVHIGDQLPQMELRVGNALLDKNDTASDVKDLEEKIDEKKDEQERRPDRIDQIRRQLTDLSGHLHRDKFRKKSDDLEKELKQLEEDEETQPLVDEIAELEKEKRQKERELRVKQKRVDDFRADVQNARDESKNPDNFPSEEEALEQSLRRKAAILRCTLDSGGNLRIDDWIERAREADSYSDVEQCVKELNRFLK
jgi:CheY-like chemotaxis protein